MGRGFGARPQLSRFATSCVIRLSTNRGLPAIGFPLKFGTRKNRGSELTQQKKHARDQDIDKSTATHEAKILTNV